MRFHSLPIHSIVEEELLAEGGGAPPHGYRKDFSEKEMRIRSVQKCAKIIKKFKNVHQHVNM